MPILLNRPATYFVLYFMGLLCLAPYNLLSLDTFYYWDWSRHLALSYYDGPPLIAWMIRLCTLAFGETLFALSFAGILMTAITGIIIYHTARFFLSSTASFVALALWLFSPLVTMDLLKQTTYDNPLLLFWALCLYFVVRFIKYQRISALYGMGVSAGLMLLSKYSGIVLLLSFLIFLTVTHWRFLFKTWHFYLIILLTTSLFMPVLIWNYQHDWLSFVYQLTTHQLPHQGQPIVNSVWTFLTVFLPALNIMLLPGVICWLKKNTPAAQMNETTRSIIILCQVINIVFFCFYLLVASKACIREYWLTPYLISSALLGGFCFERFFYQKAAYTVIGLYVAISLGLMINNAHPLHSTHSKKFIYYHLIQQFNNQLPNTPTTVFTSGWLEARLLFFVTQKPNIYALGCGEAVNQYALWNETLRQKLHSKTLKDAWYISMKPNTCLTQYMNSCEQLPTLSSTYRQKNYSLYVWHCKQSTYKNNSGIGTS